MSDRFRWGILGTGSIAKKFAEGLKAVPDADLVAVGSRSQSTADAFADTYEAPRRHATYEDLASDPEVDAIYVATPHSAHRDNSILCLEAGKAVLCEKPFTINRKQADDVVSVARDRKVFLMEAMWSRYQPIMYKVREWLAEGAIGEVNMLSADFGFRSRYEEGKRLWTPELGGGALMDVGVYPVSFSSMVYGGPPTRITALSDMHDIGVDEVTGIVLGHVNGGLAVVYTSIRSSTPQGADILGTEGSIKIQSPFWHATTATLKAGKREETVELPVEGNGYNCEAEEVMRCVRAGKLESDIMPLDETLSVMTTLDSIRKEIGLKYPME